MGIPDYGFPRCYTSFPNYETNFVNSNDNEEVRPLTNAQRYPYLGATEAQCDPGESTNQNLNKPLIGLGPHWSPTGLAIYEQTGGANDLPSEFDKTLIVASHGSWNRSPWIGYKVQSYDISSAGKTSSTPYYAISSQRSLLSP